MKAALELQHLVAALVGACETHRVERRFGARRHETHPLGAGHGAHHLLGQLDGAAIRREEGGAVGELRLHGGVDLGVRVAHQHRPGAQEVVDELVTRLVPDAARPALLDDEVEGQIAKAAGRQHRVGAIEKRLLFALRIRHREALPGFPTR